MKIIVVGSGYVGLCTAVGFATLGHDVVCVDVDEEKVDKINKGEVPIYEEGLDKMLSQALQENKLHATTNIESVKETDFVFVAVGTPSKENGSIDLKSPIMRTDLKTAELIKYASNAFLATKITFINEIGNMCKNLGIDVYDVAEGMGLDKRIGKNFLQAGIGFGGSCFRKDVEALLSKTKETRAESKILSTVLDINKDQPLRIVYLLKKRLPDLEGKTIAVLGLAFKEGTDDIRDAPSISIIAELLKHGCVVKSYDPKASDNMSKIYPYIDYCNSVGAALNETDACLILTAWDEFKKLSDKDFSNMKSKIIIEGRKVLDKSLVTSFEGVLC